MTWLFWRRGPIREAEKAKRQAESERPEVERLVHDVRARGERNNFAPRIQRAFRGES